jgi:transcriptional regulator with XRE-family HTH domain
MAPMMLRMDARSTDREPAGDPLEEFSQAFGSRLTQLRGARGWKQRELSRRAEIDPGRLSKLERGVARVSVPELIRLSLALGAGLDELVFGAPNSLEGEWHRLLQDLEGAGGAQAVACATRLLQALLLSYQAPAGASSARPHDARQAHGSG